MQLMTVTQMTGDPTDIVGEVGYQLLLSEDTVSLALVKANFAEGDETERYTEESLSQKSDEELALILQQKQLSDKTRRAIMDTLNQALETEDCPLLPMEDETEACFDDDDPLKTFYGAAVTCEMMAGFGSQVCEQEMPDGSGKTIGEYCTCSCEQKTEDCDDTDACVATCSAEPTTCDEYKSEVGEGGCAETCCESVTKPYEDALCGDKTEESTEEPTQDSCTVISCEDGCERVGADDRGCGGYCECEETTTVEATQVDPCCESFQDPEGTCMDTCPIECPISVGSDSCQVCDCPECVMVDCMPGCDLVDTDSRGCGGTCECELPECTCSSYQTGATSGTEMCQFGDDCATATNFGGSCPEGSSTQCVLVIEEPTTTGGAYTCGSTM